MLLEPEAKLASKSHRRRLEPLTGAALALVFLPAMRLKAETESAPKINRSELEK